MKTIKQESKTLSYSCDVDFGIDVDKLNVFRDEILMVVKTMQIDIAKKLAATKKLGFRKGHDLSRTIEKFHPILVDLEADVGLIFSKNPPKIIGAMGEVVVPVSSDLNDDLVSKPGLNIVSDNGMPRIKKSIFTRRSQEDTQKNNVEDKYFSTGQQVQSNREINMVTSNG